MWFAWTEKPENHVIISMEAEKAFDKIQRPFLIETPNKLGIEGRYLNTIKAKYDKPTVSIELSGENLKTFPQRSGEISRVHKVK